ncbi:MAG: hypothetical protein SNF99_06460, partial [Rikenellaceae bacterium]
FDIAPLQPKPSRRRRSVLMSLYSDSTTSQEREIIITPSISDKEVEPSQEKDPIGASVQSIFAESIEKPILTVADTLSTSVETVADRLSGEMSHEVISDKLAYNSFSELGINERYLLARDLFGDDSQLCNQTLEHIEAYEDYDDAMIYIAENFNWNPDVEGTKLLLSILENKFNIR